MVLLLLALGVPPMVAIAGCRSDTGGEVILPGGTAPLRPGAVPGTTTTTTTPTTPTTAP